MVVVFLMKFTIQIHSSQTSKGLAHQQRIHYNDTVFALIIRITVTFHLV